MNTCFCFFLNRKLFLSPKESQHVRKRDSPGSPYLVLPRTESWGHPLTMAPSHNYFLTLESMVFQEGPTSPQEFVQQSSGAGSGGLPQGEVERGTGKLKGLPAQEREEAAFYYVDDDDGETCLLSSCKSEIVGISNQTLHPFFKKSFTADIS